VDTAPLHPLAGIDMDIKATKIIEKKWSLENNSACFAMLPVLENSQSFRCQRAEFRYQPVDLFIFST
jgi:hypothetical protein